MGRRALPKIPEGFDLSEHLLDAKQMQPPLTPEVIFAGASGEIEIEVGSGKGLFLATAAEKNPERLFLGIEIAGRYTRYIAYQLACMRLANARAIHGDAEVFFRDFVLPDQLSAVHIYFPDPWWKRRHRKRRVVNQDFLGQVTRTLKPGGRLHFWTDVEEYFQKSLKLIADATPLAGPLAVPEPTDSDYLSHFERRKRQDGKTIFRSEFVKEDT